MKRIRNLNEILFDILQRRTEQLVVQRPVTGRDCSDPRRTTASFVATVRSDTRRESFGRTDHRVGDLHVTVGKTTRTQVTRYLPWRSNRGIHTCETVAYQRIGRSDFKLHDSRENGSDTQHASSDKQRANLALGYYGQMVGHGY